MDVIAGPRYSMHVQGCVLTGEDRDSAEDSLADKAGDEEEGRHVGCSTAYADACSPVERNDRNEQVELNAWWVENVESVKTEFHMVAERQPTGGGGSSDP